MLLALFLSLEAVLASFVFVGYHSTLRVSQRISLWLAINLNIAFYICLYLLYVCSFYSHANFRQFLQRLVVKKS